MSTLLLNSYLTLQSCLLASARILTHLPMYSYIITGIFKSTLPNSLFLISKFVYILLLTSRSLSSSLITYLLLELNFSQSDLFKPHFSQTIHQWLMAGLLEGNDQEIHSIISHIFIKWKKWNNLAHDFGNYLGDGILVI